MKDIILPISYKTAFHIKSILWFVIFGILTGLVIYGSFVIHHAFLFTFFLIGPFAFVSSIEHWEWDRKIPSIRCRCDKE